MTSFSGAVFQWRTRACCVWCVILSLPGLMAFKFLSESLMWQSWTIVPSLRSAGFMAAHLSLMIGIVTTYSLTYTAKLPVFKTRLAALWNVLHPDHFIIIFGFSVLGALSSWCLTESVGYASGLWHTCEVNRVKRKCMNEHLWFCIFYGAVCGFCYGCGYFFSKEYFLVFPSLQESKLFRLRGHLCSHMWDGVVWTLRVLRLYYPLYYLSGSTLRLYFMNLLQLLPAEEPGLDSFAGLLNMSLLAHLILVGCFLHISWSFALRLFRAYHTQALRFPVVATFSQDSHRLLEVALTSDCLLLKFLGFLDLFQLALHSPQRRKQVFSLSTTGQPQVWSSVCEQCLQVVRSLTERLSHGKNKFRVTTQTSSSSLPAISSTPLHNSSAKGWSTLPTKELLGTPGASRRHVFNEKARLWSYSPGHSVERVPTCSMKENAPSPIRVALTQVKSFVSSIPKRLAERLKKKPFFIYFLNELPDTTNQELFSDCQLQVWAITSISELAVASYAEDTYGVVQKFLTVVVESLVDLSQALDKHVKAPLSCSTSTRNVRVALEANGRYAVKTAVQTALFRLAATFSKERRSIHLSPDHHQYWNKYFMNN